STFTFTVQCERGGSGGLLPADVNWKDVRVLAVDDEPEIQEYFREIAQRLGLACDVVSSGPEALDLIRRTGPYDVCFVDWRMPGMSGTELARHIQRECVDKSVVVMISATEWSVIEQEAKAAGVHKFLPKPLFPSAIADSIGECLGSGTLLPQEEDQSVQTACFAGRCALLAEDVEINQEILLALLEPTSLAFDCAENGRKAVDLFTKNPEKYDIIFMDVQMPELDGYEATQRIRALPFPRAKTVPIIAMTANVFREDVEKCLEAGMNEHVGKPIGLNEVLEKLHKYLPAAPDNEPESG
ncbi:MAG: response regulator, partial [Deltaproteobacteria bacterium]|nr:response regulator [Deltaproteobacteria bacterium]